jgi:hypothetical protein
MNKMGVSAFPDAERRPYVPKIIAEEDAERFLGLKDVRLEH